MLACVILCANFILSGGYSAFLVNTAFCWLSSVKWGGREIHWVQEWHVKMFTVQAVHYELFIQCACLYLSCPYWLNGFKVKITQCRSSNARPVIIQSNCSIVPFLVIFVKAMKNKSNSIYHHKYISQKWISHNFNLKILFLLFVILVNLL